MGRPSECAWCTSLQQMPRAWRVASARRFCKSKVNSRDRLSCTKSLFVPTARIAGLELRSWWSGEVLNARRRSLGSGAPGAKAARLVIRPRVRAQANESGSRLFSNLTPPSSLSAPHRTTLLSPFLLDPLIPPLASFRPLAPCRHSFVRCDRAQCLFVAIAPALVHREHGARRNAWICGKFVRKCSLPLNRASLTTGHLPDVSSVAQPNSLRIPRRNRHCATSVSSSRLALFSSGYGGIPRRQTTLGNRPRHQSSALSGFRLRIQRTSVFVVPVTGRSPSTPVA